MSAPVLPLLREGGYWLFSAGEQRFVSSGEVATRALPDKYFQPGGKAKIIQLFRDQEKRA